MHSLTVDDRELIVNSVINIMNKLDPEGTHLGALTPDDALTLASENRFDVAFLDIELPGHMDGLTLGKNLRDRFPDLNIIFITGHKEYALDAFDIDASGYLLKPVTEEAVSHQLSILRYKGFDLTAQKIQIRCFGMFEAFHNGRPVDFSYSKTKEVLACLIDHKGAICSNDTIIGCLFPEEPANNQTKARLRKYIQDLKAVFAKAGVPEAIIHKERVGIGLDTNLIECDYLNYLSGDPVAIHQYHGEYMSQYSFAEETRAALYIKAFNIQ